MHIQRYMPKVKVAPDWATCILEFRFTSLASHRRKSRREESNVHMGAMMSYIYIYIDDIVIIMMIMMMTTTMMMVMMMTIIITITNTTIINV